MKTLLTKTIYSIAALILLLGITLPAFAQTYTSSAIESGNHASAIAKDASGNVYVLRIKAGTGSIGGGATGEIVKYTNGTGAAVNLVSSIPDEDQPGDWATGLTVMPNGDIYYITDNGGSVEYGNIMKLQFNSGTSYTQSVFKAGTSTAGYYSALASDGTNLYAIQYDFNGDGNYHGIGSYEVVEFVGLSTTATIRHQKLGEAGLDNALNDASSITFTVPTGLAINSLGDIYASDGFSEGAGINDGGKIIKLTKASSYSASTISTGFSATALAFDASDNLYASQAGSTTVPASAYGLYLYPGGTATQSPTVLYTPLHTGSTLYPYGIAVVNDKNIFVTDGEDVGNSFVNKVFHLYGPPATQALNVNFTNINATVATVNWTNGSGGSRAVFMKNANSGQPTPVNNTTYSANTVFGTVGSQIGATGWYCVYNGTGSTVNVTGLTQGQTYQVMAVEYNGPALSENYLQTAGTNNPNSVTTISPTTITSLNRLNGTPTSLATVNFAAVFGSAVTGVTASNFTVTTTGVTGVTNASIGTPTTGDNITWTVPVSSGTGDGTIQLSLANATGMSKSISTSLPFAGQTYDIDKTAPTVSISAPSVSVAKASTTVTYTITYADASAITNIYVSALDLYSNTVFTGTAQVNSLTVHTAVGNTQVVDFNIAGNGTVAFKVPGGAATDAAGNLSALSGLSASFTADNTAPTVTIARSDPSPIGNNVLDFQAVFSEPVSNVSPDDFAMTNSGVTTGAISVTNTGDDKTYNITVINTVGDGTARLDLNAGTNIADVAGNVPAGFTDGEVYTIDQTAPTVSSITATTPSNTNPTNSASLVYTVVFSEAVTNLAQGDFTVTTLSGNATGSVSGITGSGDTYQVTLGSVSGNGTLRLDLKSSGTGIVDIAANPVSGGFNTGNVYTIDHTAPSGFSASFLTNNTNAGYAKVGDVVTLTFTTTEAVQPPTITISGHAVTPTDLGSNKWSGSYTETSGDTDGQQAFSLDLYDLAGNHTNYNSAGVGGLYVILDSANPTVTAGSPTPAITGSGTGNTVSFAVHYDDAYFNAATLSTGDITLNTTGTANATVGLTGSSTDYTVTLSGITGFGTLGITIGAGTATDRAGNLADASAASATVDVVSPDATLSGLTTALRKVAPIFNPSVTTGYTTFIPYTGTSTTITAITNEPNATIQARVNGGSYVPVTSGVASPDLALDPGANTIDVLVTAADLVTTKTYTVTTTRAHSSFLTNLTYSPPSLKKTKVTGSNFIDYAATVDPSVNTVSVTPVADDATSIITVNGETVVSGATSSPITLVNGPNTINTVVTTVDNVSTRTYSIVVTKQGVATLNSLTYNPGLTLHRVAGSHDFDYTATVAASSITVTPVATDPSATITVNGSPVASGSESAPIALNLGQTTITTIATAADGVTTKSYSTVITRNANALLATLTYSPLSIKKTKVSGSNYVDYVATVDASIMSTTVTPVVQDPTSTVTVNGTPVASGAASDPITLALGTTTINTVVTASDGTTSNTYSIVISRTASALLSSLTYDPGLTVTKVTGSHDFDYTAKISNSSVRVIPVTEDAAATVTVNNTAVTSGSPSDPIALNLGDNVITTVVTASDGVSTKTYSITVTRQPNALLATLAYSPASIKKVKVAGSDYVDYTSTVKNAVSEVTVTPVVQDPTSTVTVNGAPVASGAASDAIALMVGDNTINTIVTAADGTTSNTYSIVITRQGPTSGFMAYDPAASFSGENTPILVHQNVSPNGDGRGDAMKIDNIAAYPDNKLQIMSRNGNLVFEVKGYDNATKVFDGHANDGKLQQAGTYFYSLEYKVGNAVKRKTGYIVLKY